MTIVVVFSGLPGSGKSVLAEHAARLLEAPLFAKDVIEAALWRSEIRREQRSGWIAYELLTALADAQLARGSSVVMDSVGPNEGLRSGWRQMALRRGASFRAVECVVTDPVVHRERMEHRRRDIPGWYELTWQDVEDVRAPYEPWVGERLVLDAMQPLATNIAALTRYLGVEDSG